MTHSLEVATVGRSLGHRLVSFLKRRNELPPHIHDNDILWIIQSACLAHDIGNPPFGHAGEFAIREWIKTHPAEVFGNARHAISPGILNDCEIFEGNAQGFRISARADNPQPGYLRLTFASLGAMIKYPWTSTDPRAAAKQKFNVFSTEESLFLMVAHHTGMKQSSGTIVRHPLSFLSEAADDICYRILDLEDAAEMNILDEQRVRDIYLSLLSDASSSAKLPLAVLRGQAIASLIDGAWRVFEADYLNVMAGQRSTDLKSGFDSRLKDAVHRINHLYGQIFADRTKVAAELGAYKALGRIIKALGQATRQLSSVDSYDGVGFLARRCLELAWGEAYARENISQPYEWWLHQTLDYVSGLTDNYARQLSREIEGT
jgi:dGTPase